MLIENRILKLSWTPAAWEDYLYWQGQDRKTLKRINLLIKDCMRQPFDGIGKPEPLKENLAGFWSRRIDDTHSIVNKHTKPFSDNNLQELSGSVP